MTLTIASGTQMTNSSYSTSIEINAFHSFVHNRELPDCLKLGHYRTTSQMIWACLATIFACIWVAVHPNIPGLHESGFQHLRRRVFVAVGAIIAPEFMAIWATRQRHAAQIIKREFNDKFNDGVDPELTFRQKARRWFTGAPTSEVARGWTLTHAFFVQIGGFMMYHEGKPVQVLTFDRMLGAIARGEIDVPHIPEEDILDKSKGDGLSKLVVVLQTTWFVAQCIGRWLARFPLAQLEVLTLGFAVLNAFYYAIWWSKPQSVLHPIKLEFKVPPKSSVPGTHCVLSRASSTSSLDSVVSAPNTVDHETVAHPNSHAASSSESESAPIAPHPASRASRPRSPSLLLESAGVDGVYEASQPFIEELFDKESFHWSYRKLNKLLSSVRRSPDTSLLRYCWTLLGVLPRIGLLTILYPLRTAAKTEMNLESKRPSNSINPTSKFTVGRTRVPMFYAEERGFGNSIAFWFSTLFVPLIFGGIHLTLWSSMFQNSFERWLWRGSSIYITAEPFLFLAAYFGERLIKPKSQSAASYTAVGITLLFYTIARCILIFMSLFTLLDLPEEMYMSPQWTDILPHI